jgi:hypothetical protein
MDDNQNKIDIVPTSNLETEKKFISLRNESIENKEFKSSQFEQRDPFHNQKNINLQGRKNSFIKFMRHFDEYKNDDDILKLKKVKINRSQTVRYDDVIQIEEDQLNYEDVKQTNSFENIGKLLKKALLSKYFSILATLAIIIILFLEDLRVIVIHKKYDTLVDVIMLLMIIFIFLEISLFILLVKSYRFSFFFWLDICSFCSLIPDIMILFIHDEHLDYYNMSNNSR